MNVFSHRVDSIPLMESYDVFLRWCIDCSISHSLSIGHMTTMVTIVPSELVDEFLMHLESMREEHNWHIDNMGVLNALAT